MTNGGQIGALPHWRFTGVGPWGLVLVAVLTTSVAGCVGHKGGNKDGPAGGSAQSFKLTGHHPVTVRDGLGRTVALGRPARRIVSLAPGFTEILFAVGCGERVVARDKWSDYPEAVKELPVTPSLHPNPEHIAGFQPDLVLIYADDDRDLPPFAHLDIPVALFDPKNFDEVVENVKTVGRLCGRPDAAKKVATEMAMRRDRVLASPLQPAPEVYVEVDGGDDGRPWTAARGSFVDELLRLAGAKNIFEDLDRPYAQVSSEQVIGRDPQVVILPAHQGRSMGASHALEERPGFSTIRAVKQHRVITGISADVLSRPGPRLVDGLEQLHNQLRRQELP